MLRILNVPSIRVEGYIKDLYFEPGDHVNRTKHVWNIAYIMDAEGHAEWHIFDVATDAENYHGFSYTESRRTSQQSYSVTSEDLATGRPKTAGSSRSGYSMRRKRDTLKNILKRSSYEVEDISSSRNSFSEADRPLTSPSKTRATIATLSTDIHHLIDDAYFSPAPFDMIKTHFPLNPEYQLLKYPLNIRQFEALPVIRDIFPSLNLALKGASGEPIVKTDDGEVELTFSYKTSRLLTFNANLTKWGLLKSYDKGDVCYFTKVNKSEQSAEVTFIARLAEPGQYRLSVQSAPILNQHFHNVKPKEVAVYKVIWEPSTSTKRSELIVPPKHLPIKCCMGFGPYSHFMINNFLIDGDTRIGKLISESGLFDLNFYASNPMVMELEYKIEVEQYNDDWEDLVIVDESLYQLTKNYQNGSINVTMVAPGKGEYAMRLFYFSTLNQIWMNLCNYFLTALSEYSEGKSSSSVKSAKTAASSFIIPEITITIYSDEDFPNGGNYMQTVEVPPEEEIIEYKDESASSENLNLEVPDFQDTHSTEDYMEPRSVEELDERKIDEDNFLKDIQNRFSPQHEAVTVSSLQQETDSPEAGMMIYDDEDEQEDLEETVDAEDAAVFEEPNSIPNSDAPEIDDSKEEIAAYVGEEEFETSEFMPMRIEGGKDDQQGQLSETESPNLFGEAEKNMGPHTPDTGANESQTAEQIESFIKEQHETFDGNESPVPGTDEKNDFQGEISETQSQTPISEEANLAMAEVDQKEDKCANDDYGAEKIALPDSAEVVDTGYKTRYHENDTDEATSQKNQDLAIPLERDSAGDEEIEAKSLSVKTNSIIDDETDNQLQEQEDESEDDQSLLSEKPQSIKSNILNRSLDEKGKQTYGNQENDPNKDFGDESIDSHLDEYVQHADTQDTENFEGKVSEPDVDDYGSYGSLLGEFAKNAEEQTNESIQNESTEVVEDEVTETTEDESEGHFEEQPASIENVELSDHDNKKLGENVENQSGELFENENLERNEDEKQEQHLEYRTTAIMDDETFQNTGAQLKENIEEPNEPSEDHQAKGTEDEPENDDAKSDEYVAAPPKELNEKTIEDNEINSNEYFEDNQDIITDQTSEQDEESGDVQESQVDEFTQNQSVENMGDKPFQYLENRSNKSIEDHKDELCENIERELNDSTENHQEEAIDGESEQDNEGLNGYVEDQLENAMRDKSFESNGTETNEHIEIQPSQENEDIDFQEENPSDSVEDQPVEIVDEKNSGKNNAEHNELTENQTEAIIGDGISDTNDSDSYGFDEELLNGFTDNQLKVDIDDQLNYLQNDEKPNELFQNNVENTIEKQSDGGCQDFDGNSDRDGSNLNSENGLKEVTDNRGSETNDPSEKRPQSTLIFKQVESESQEEFEVIIVEPETTEIAILDITSMPSRPTTTTIIASKPGTSEPVNNTRATSRKSTSKSNKTKVSSTKVSRSTSRRPSNVSRNSKNGVTTETKVAVPHPPESEKTRRNSKISQRSVTIKNSKSLTGSESKTREATPKTKTPPSTTSSKIKQHSANGSVTRSENGERKKKLSIGEEKLNEAAGKIIVDDESKVHWDIEQNPEFGEKINSENDEERASLVETDNSLPLSNEEQISENPDSDSSILNGSKSIPEEMNQTAEESETKMNESMLENGTESNQMKLEMEVETQTDRSEIEAETKIDQSDTEAGTKIDQSELEAGTNSDKENQMSVISRTPTYFKDYSQTLETEEVFPTKMKTSSPTPSEEDSEVGDHQDPDDIENLNETTEHLSSPSPEREGSDEEENRNTEKVETGVEAENESPTVLEISQHADSEIEEPENPEFDETSGKLENLMFSSMSSKNTSQFMVEETEFTTHRQANEDDGQFEDANDMESLHLPINDSHGHNNKHSRRKRSSVEQDQKILEQIIQNQSQASANGRISQKAFTGGKTPANFDSSEQLSEYADTRREIHRTETARKAALKTGTKNRNLRKQNSKDKKKITEAITEEISDSDGEKNDEEQNSEKGFESPLLNASADEAEMGYGADQVKSVDLEKTEANLETSETIFSAKEVKYPQFFTGAVIESEETTIQKAKFESVGSEWNINSEEPPEEIGALSASDLTYSTAEESDQALVQSRPKLYCHQTASAEIMSEESSQIVDIDDLEKAVAVSLDETFKRGLFKKCFRSPWQFESTLALEVEVTDVPDFECGELISYRSGRIKQAKKSQTEREKIYGKDKRPQRFRDPNYLKTIAREIPDELKRPLILTSRFRREMERLNIRDDDESQIGNQNKNGMKKVTVEQIPIEEEEKEKELSIIDENTNQNQKEPEKENLNQEKKKKSKLIVKLNRACTQRSLFVAQSLPLNKSKAEIYTDPIGKDPLPQDPFNTQAFSRSLTRELKSYRKPGYIIRNIVKATFILLGESPLGLDDWEILCGLLSRSLYKDSLTVRMANCNKDDVTDESRDRAFDLMQQIPEEDVERISKPVKVLFDWVKTVL